MKKHPFPHTVIVKKRVVNPNFEIGKGAIINLNLCSYGLIKLLRKVYLMDSKALKISGASHDFLFNPDNKDFNGESIPCTAFPKPICYQPKIITDSPNGN